MLSSDLQRCFKNASIARTAIGSPIATSPSGAIFYVAPSACTANWATPFAPNSSASASSALVAESCWRAIVVATARRCFAFSRKHDAASAMSGQVYGVPPCDRCAECHTLSKLFDPNCLAGASGEAGFSWANDRQFESGSAARQVATTSSTSEVFTIRPLRSLRGIVKERLHKPPECKSGRDSEFLRPARP